MDIQALKTDIDRLCAACALDFLVRQKAALQAHCQALENDGEYWPEQPYA